jgi:hypothetical protein
MHVNNLRSFSRAFLARTSFGATIHIFSGSDLRNEIAIMMFLRRLSKLASWYSIGHIAAGICLSIIVVVLNAEKRSSFNCVGRSVKAEDWCFSKYERTYDFPLPYVYFIFLNFGLVYIATLIYSFCARNCDHCGNVNLVYLVFQLLFGTLFTFLQHGVLYPKGFEPQFNCTFPSTEPQFELTYKYAICENLTAVNKDLVLLFVSMANGVVALISLVEFVRLLRPENFSFLACVQWMVWSRDSDDNIYCFRIRIKGNVGVPPPHIISIPSSNLLST